MSIKTYAMAVRDTIAAEMRRDERVFIMGEDIETIGSIFGCTRDLTKEFGRERAFNTPISEAGFVGMGLGAACTGMRPIVELLYMDFSFCAMDQLLNQVAKTRYIFGGNAKIPLVIRGQEGIGRGNAATHSQSVETIFMHFPGIKVACPANARDAAGLLRTAIRDDNPVMVIEHKALYSKKMDVPDDPDFMLPFGKADIKRSGKDVTIVSNLLYVDRSLEAAEALVKEGIEAEVIDPMTLVPFDKETVINSVKKTGRLVVVHEAHRNAGWGAEVAAMVAEEAFRYLDAAPVRLGTKACPLPFNVGLENAATPQISDIIEACRRVCYR